MPLAWFEFVTTGSWSAVWFWLLCLIVVAWLRRHLDLNRARHEPILSAAERPDDIASLPPLTVLVAAKDEEANIGACLAGLVSQEYPNLQIVVANDRSTDQTGPIINDFAARDPRVRAVHISHLPEGWAGKNHAMHQAVQHATGRYLLFTDADCRFHDPHLLAAAVHFAQSRNADFLSVLPDLDADTFWERVVQPPAGGILVFWYPPEKVNNPDKPHAYANGAFMLLASAAYDTIGGHADLRSIIGEDMAMARRAKRLGFRLRVIRGGGMYSVRMYTGLRAIWAGWTRIFYICFNSLARLLASILVLSLISILPYVSLLLSPFLPEIGPGIALAASAAILAQQSILWRFYALNPATPPHWALTYPIGAFLCLLMMLNALRYYMGQSLTWRGTTYQKTRG